MFGQRRAVRMDAHGDAFEAGHGVDVGRGDIVIGWWVLAQVWDEEVVVVSRFGYGGAVGREKSNQGRGEAREAGGGQAVMPFTPVDLTADWRGTGRRCGQVNGGEEGMLADDLDRQKCLDSLPGLEQRWWLSSAASRELVE